ncbi:MAG: aminopeptidase, partial [Candidatus Marinimicrobia bacterium]|nr:aminopeptidase [Candidatus Neomarinimicrobiota bacterium]
MCLNMKRLVLLITAVFTTGLFTMSCSQKSNENQSARPDPTSLSNIDEVRITHLDLDLEVLFDSKQLTGSASLQIDNITDTDELILDTWGLTIHRVTLGEAEQETPYQLGDEVQYYGRPLTIQIQPRTKIVTVYYTTSPDAQALQWVEPEQTAQKTDPYLYSQSQFILARSWIPCQDSPGVRMTYNATIRTEPEYLALMSAENEQQKNDTGIYTFQMEQPIPSYLMALAVGDIEFRSISDRAGIYAEPPVVDSAAWEFAETDEMIQAAEKL